MKSTNRFVISSASALLALLPYLNALRNPFVYDDYHTVVANGSLHQLTNIRAIILHDVTRPLVNFSYAVDQAIWGGTPFGFHLTNLILHVLNVLILCHLAWRLAEDASLPAHVVGFVSASLFAVHPMMTEAVGYISGRSEVLCATFFLLAFLCGRRWVREGGGRWALPTIALWIGALGAKETGAMFPFVLLAHNWLTDSRTRWEIHAPLIAVTVLAGIVRVAVLAFVEYPGQAAIHWDYLLIGMDVMRRYAWLVLRPSGQTIFHEVAGIGLFTPQALLATGWLALLLVLCWTLRRSVWIASLGILWFLLLLVPSTALVTLNQGEPMAEHRVYLASCGLFLAIGCAAGRFSLSMVDASRWLGLMARAALAIVLLSFGVETVLRNAVWADPITLWRESASLAPTHYRPRLLLGEALSDAGRESEAIEEFKTAVRLRPTDPTGHIKLGGSMASRGDFRAAREHFLDALKLDPQNATAHRGLTILDKIDPEAPGHGARR